jgi:hypothetical protein
MKATIRRVGVPICAVAIFLAAGCNDHDTVQNTKMDYEGTVTDAATGAPIAGATVSTSTCDFLFCNTTGTATTDAQGHYTVFRECYSNNWLSAFAEGYVGTEREANCGPSRQVANFALDRSP